jgi:lysophospholipase L1-like esterase
MAPLDGSFYHSFNDELIELNELIKEQAQATVIDVYSVLAPDWAQLHSGDRVHLNDLGNQRVAQKIAEDYLNPYPPKPDTVFMSALEILLLD